MKSTVSRRELLIGGMAGLTAFARRVSAANPAGQLKILVITGGHAYKTSLYKVFTDKPEWTWDHEYPAAHALRRDLRKQYDALVLYDMTVPDIGESAQLNLKNFIESGKGVVVLHHAILNKGYGEWWYKDIVGGMYIQEPMLGKAVKSSYAHGESMTVRPTKVKHPITDGIGTFTIIDEAYKDKWISDNITVLLETDHPKDDGPILWVSPYDRARIVYMELGHDDQAHLNPTFQELVRRCILWVTHTL